MEKTISSDFIRGHIDTIILKSLFDGSKHALEISQYIEEKSGNQYEVKQATLYSALKRLETKNFVRPFWNDAPVGGRRRYFTATQAGLDYANKILSEWDYSRDIIDTLIDKTPSKKIHSPTTEINTEKKSDFNVLSENNKTTQQVIIINQTPTVNNNDNDKIITNKEQLESFSQKNVVDKIEDKTPTLQQTKDIEISQKQTIESVDKKSKYNEVNYKEILGNLFDSIQTKQQDVETEKTENQPNESIESPIQKDFTTENFAEDLLVKPQNAAETDFSDLIEKADAEGYKIRISSNKAKKISGKILINKVNLTTSLIFFLITLIEVLTLSFVYKKYQLFNIAWYFVAIAAFAVYPAFSITNYLKNPLKTINRYNHNNTVTVAIICVNALLFILAIALLSDVQFNNVYQLALKIIIPSLLVFDVFALFLIKHFVVKNKNYVTK